MYLLFKQSVCHYCKCGILRRITILHKRVCIQVKLWLYLVCFCSMKQPEVFLTPPPPLPPEWDASPSQYYPQR